MGEDMHDNQMSLLKNNLLVVGGYALISVLGLVLYLISFGSGDSAALLVGALSFIVTISFLIFWGYAVISPLPRYNYLSVLLLALLLCIPAIIFVLQKTTFSSGRALDLFLFETFRSQRNTQRKLPE